MGNFAATMMRFPVTSRQQEEKFMRAVLLILILGVVALIALFATGLGRHIADPRGPGAAHRGGDGAIRAQGGQSPAFEVQTGSVEVGTREANVAVPKIEVKRGKAQVKSRAWRSAGRGAPGQRRQLTRCCRALQA